MFRYFKEGSSLEENGQIFRVLEDEADTFVNKKLENGEQKYWEVDFATWWDDGVAEDTKAAFLNGAEAGTFVDDTVPGEGPLILSFEDGEPVNEE